MSVFGLTTGFRRGKVGEMVIRGIRVVVGFVFAVAALPSTGMAQSAGPQSTPLPQSTAAASATPSAPDGVVRATFANGLRVVVVPNRLAPVVTEVLTYGVGANDDTIPGIAHATEHMMFRGTGDISSDQLAGIATRTGAEYNAETTNLATRFYFTLPSAYLGVALHLEADRMTGAAMREADWKTERGAIEQEVKAHLSNPLHNVSVRISQLFYGNSPYASDAVGTLDGFEKMTASDIASFYHTWYHPNNATLVIAGNVDAATTLRDVHAAFDAIPAAQLPNHAPIVLAPLPTSTIDEAIDFPIPIAAVAFRLPGSHEADYAASQVLAEALNNGRGTLAQLTLQGKVLAAIASASAYPEVGSGFVLAAARPGSDPKDTLALIQGVLKTYAGTGIPPELVEAAKTRLLASRAFDGASIPGEALDWSSSLTDGDDSPSAIYGALANVRVDDVNRVLRAYAVGASNVALTLRAKSNATIPHVDQAAAVENVKITATQSVTFPQWTQGYFSAPLQAPRADDVAKTVRLRNGIMLAVRRESFSPTVVLVGAIRSSPELYEPKGREGVADMTQALLPFGTTTYDYTAYQAQLDAIAANVSLGTTFTMTVRAQDFDKAVALLADGELHPAFSPGYFALVQRNTVQSLKVVEHRAETQASIARMNALYPPGDPRRRRATAATSAAVTIDDVKRWYAFAYRPDVTAISVVGDVDPAHARAVIESQFGDWKATGARPTFAYPRLQQSAKTTSVTVRSNTNKHSDVTLTQVLGIRRGDPDVFALRLANTILSGEGTGSLLFREVRKARGDVYAIDSSIDIGKTESSFSIDFSSDTKNIADAQGAAVAQIQRLRRDLLPTADVQRAKALLLAQGVLELDTYDGVASDLLRNAENGVDANDTYRYYAQLLATTPQQIRDAMRRWIDPARFSRVIIAPDS